VRRSFLALLVVFALAAAACTGGGGETTTEEPELGGGTDAAPEPADSPTEVAQGEDQGTAQQGQTLSRVRSRGNVICGANTEVPGFGALDPNGDFVGFDVDFCKAVAAALFNDPEAVEFRPLASAERFPALKSGEIDVLIRNTTWTATRDGSEQATFLQPNFYDGQGMMVRAEDGFGGIEDMANTTVCATSGTTTELNLATRFQRDNIPYEPLIFPDNEQLQAAFVEGRCDGWTSDKSQLAAVRSAFPADAGGPESLVILDETFSKEPLAPAVQDGDSQWAQVINWVVFATIQAEEFGITQDNVDGFSSEDPNVLAFLGQPTEEGGQPLDPGLGFDDPAWAANVIRAVGNYGEIYERHITPLGIERGVNNLWTEDGLLYAPPYR
jgi:general L-amino acid transport system substrate-binding protein